MAYTAHSGDFGLSGDRTAQVANGLGAKLARLARRLSDAPAAQRQREVDREIALLLARSGGRITDIMGAPRRQSGCVPRQAFRGRHGV